MAEPRLRTDVGGSAHRLYLDVRTQRPNATRSKTGECARRTRVRFDSGGCRRVFRAGLVRRVRASAMRDGNEKNGRLGGSDAR